MTSLAALIAKWRRRPSGGRDGTVQDPRRRRLLFLTGAITMSTGIFGFLGATARYLFPNVLYEPSARFPVGRPDQYPPGVTFLPDRSLFIGNGSDGFYAISSTCPHLGCTVRSVAKGFSCPCHGSLFDANGQVTSGPSPRPLSWFGLNLSPRGELVVDLQRVVEPAYRFKV
jgi:nitrite reductase/ring-hydroxylating ferredoxin subunit